MLLCSLSLDLVNAEASLLILCSTRLMAGGKLMFFKGEEAGGLAKQTFTAPQSSLHRCCRESSLPVPCPFTERISEQFTDPPHHPRLHYLPPRWFPCSSRPQPACQGAVTLREAGYTHPSGQVHGGSAPSRPGGSDRGVPEQAPRGTEPEFPFGNR